MNTQTIDLNELQEAVCNVKKAIKANDYKENTYTILEKCEYEWRVVYYPGADSLEVVSILTPDKAAFVVNL